MLELHSENRPVVQPDIMQDTVIELIVKKKVNIDVGECYVAINDIDSDINDSDGLGSNLKNGEEIDVVLIKRLDEDKTYFQRFIFSDKFYWSTNLEKMFKTFCLENQNCHYDYAGFDKVYKIFSKVHPSWHLKRYYAKPMRLLDHIHHCQLKNTAKEMLYKSGLDCLAFNIDEIDELNLTAMKPSELFDGITMRTLRALNCEYGAKLLREEYTRKFIIDLQKKFPDTFRVKLNEAQCRYLLDLMEGDLTFGEAGRIFKERRDDLLLYWNETQYKDYIYKMNANDKKHKVIDIDPIYKNYFGKKSLDECGRELSLLYKYLIVDRAENDRLVRISNRKRNYDWQERGNGYVVRYPQTVNDFCRESIYQQNCLLTYWDAVINNATTILFMRKADDFNSPFITIEIYDNTLMQAYHRFNNDCSEDEAKWIIEYCKRHGISRGNFKFKKEDDLLF